MSYYKETTSHFSWRNSVAEQLTNRCLLPLVRRQVKQLVHWDMSISDRHKYIVIAHALWRGKLLRCSISLAIVTLIVSHIFSQSLSICIHTLSHTLSLRYHAYCTYSSCIPTLLSHMSWTFSLFSCRIGPFGHPVQHCRAHARAQARLLGKFQYCRMSCWKILDPFGHPVNIIQHCCVQQCWMMLGSFGQGVSLNLT